VRIARMVQLSQETLEELADFARAGRIGAGGPIIRVLRAAPKIFIGDVASVRWAVEGATDVELRVTGPQIARTIPVAAAGELEIPGLPLGKCYIEMFATNGYAATTRSLTITVAAPPPSLQSRISGAVFEFGGAPLRLRWQAERAEQVRVEFDGQATLHPARGQIELAPRRPGRHVACITALGLGGAASVRHRIRAVVPPVQVALQVPQAVGYGSPARIDWTVTGGRTVTLTVNGQVIDAAPARGALTIDAIDRALHLILSATGHDGKIHERRARVTPTLLERVVTPTDLSGLLAPLPLAAIHGRDR
ncbi:MAG: hypothetical protein ACREWG_16815, partial [Gammaproteobacteria bacterium]